MGNYKTYKVGKKRLKVISELEKIDKRFEVLKEVNPLQYMLSFQDKVYFKNRIVLRNNMILEVVYHTYYMTVYQPFIPGEKRKLVLKHIKYKEINQTVEVVREIDNIIREIEAFYIQGGNMENIKQLIEKRAEVIKEIEIEKAKYDSLQKEIEQTVSLESFDKIDNQINQTFEKIQKLEKILQNFDKNENTIIDQVKKQKDKEYYQENEIIKKNMEKISKEFLKFIEKVEKIGIETEKEIQQIEKPLEMEYQTLRAEKKINGMQYIRLYSNDVQNTEIYFKGIWGSRFEK